MIKRFHIKGLTSLPMGLNKLAFHVDMQSDHAINLNGSLLMKKVWNMDDKDYRLSKFDPYDLPSFDSEDDE